MPDDSDRPEAAGEKDARSGLRRIFVDTTPLRYSPAFARLWFGSGVAFIGTQVTVVAVGLHIYWLTESTWQVSLLALWALGPMIVAGFMGGALSDRFDRRAVALIAAIFAWSSVACMTVIAFLGVDHTWPYFLLAAINAAAGTIINAARGAILPRLLTNQMLPAASALNGISFGFAVTVGPAVAGLLVAWVGYPWTYLLDAILFTGAFVGIIGLPHIAPEGGKSSLGFRSVVESMRFLRNAPNVRATFVIDLIAMAFGTPRAVYPAIGALILGGEAITVGLLTAALAVGALLSSLFSGPLGQVRAQGRAVTLAVAAYGGFTAIFGVVLLVTQLAGGAPQDGSVLVFALLLSCLALAGAGASDNISSIFRNTIMLASAPDEVRGRMQGIFFVVVAGGPRVGDLVAGGIATAIALWAPALLGGLVIVGLMLVFLRTYRSFQNYDGLNPTP